MSENSEKKSSKKFLVLFNSEKVIMKSLSKSQLKLYTLLREKIVESDFDFGVAITAVIKSQRIDSFFEKNLFEVVKLFKSIHSNSDKHPVNLIATISKTTIKFIQDSCKYYTELKHRKDTSMTLPLLDYLNSSTITQQEDSNSITLSEKNDLKDQCNQDVNTPLTVTDTVIDTVTDNESENKKEKNKKEKTKKFIKPTLEEVKAYCEERHNNVNPEQFIAYYEANGWKVGRNPMKNWRAAIVSTWERNNYNKAPPKKDTKAFEDFFKEIEGEDLF